jgi:hypothetical protein
MIRIDGLPVVLPDACPDCGSDVAIVHNACLKCDTCDGSRGLLRADLRSHLYRIVELGGYDQTKAIPLCGRKPPRAIAAESTAA